MPLTKNKMHNLFSKNVISRDVYLDFNLVAENVRENLEIKLKDELEGKCTIEGFIKKNSINVLMYSSGVLNSTNVVFNVNFECKICRPIEGMKIKCNVVNITKAGIKATYGDELNSPVIIFIARDHNYNNKYYSTIKDGTNIHVRVIGVRYELNDENISVLAELIMPRTPKVSAKITPKNTKKYKKKGNIKL
uniref:S1 motif domain-containing protein n=1 Tax=viral metagenome TaxID=1070528 RepID=A0A6C0C2V9_9ZZZZ